MTCSVKVYSRDDQLLTELNHFQVGTRSWVINGAGDCDLAIPRNDPKATEENFGRKNLVVIESDTGIPAWGGQVQEVDWSHPGWLKIRLRSKEILLRKYLVYYQGHATPGELAYQFLPATNKRQIPGIYKGSIDSGGGIYPYQIYYWDLYDKALPELVKPTEKDEPQAHEWYVDAYGAFNWTRGRGEDKSATVVLRSGYHILKWPKYRMKYDKIVTRGLGLGSDAYWVNKTKTWWDEPSAQAKWGVWEAATDVPSNTVMRTEKYARNLVRQNWEPQEIIDIRINNRDGIWKQFWIGDTVRIVIPNFGWQENGGVDEKLRIIGIEVEEERQQMRLLGKVFTLNVD